MASRFMTVFSKSADEALAQSAPQMQKKAELTISTYTNNLEIKLQDTQRKLDNAEYEFFRGDKEKLTEIFNLKDEVEDIERDIKRSQEYLVSIQAEEK